MSDMPQVTSERVTVRKGIVNPDKIEQCDIFRNIVFVESAVIEGDELLLSEIHFPFAICLSQSCDLESDLRDRGKGEQETKGNMVLQIIMAPLFPIDQFREGSHWGDLIHCAGVDKKNLANVVKKNRDPRYHYIRFPDEDCIGPFVADFKHFFTMSRDALYNSSEKRVCSIKPLYRDDVARRFANYLSRIGLPE